MLERKKHRPDYYSILRVSAIATEGEIKAAYRCVGLWWGWGGVSGCRRSQPNTKKIRSRPLTGTLAALGEEHALAISKKGGRLPNYLERGRRLLNY